MSSADRPSHLTTAGCSGLLLLLQAAAAGRRAEAEALELAAAASGTVDEPGSGVSQSADFHFWLALLQTLLPQVEQVASVRRDVQSLEHAVGWVWGDGWEKRKGG